MKEAVGVRKEDVSFVALWFHQLIEMEIKLIRDLLRRGIISIYANSNIHEKTQEIWLATTPAGEPTSLEELKLRKKYANEVNGYCRQEIVGDLLLDKALGELGYHMDKDRMLAIKHAVKSAGFLFTTHGAIGNKQELKLACEILAGRIEYAIRFYEQTQLLASLEK